MSTTSDAYIAPGVDLPPCPITADTMHIMVVPHLSSRHVTEDDWKVLTTDTGPVILGELDAGASFLLIIGGCCDRDGESYKDCSKAFRDLVKHVADRGYGYLRLSHEGDTLPGFPTFDW